MIQDERLYFIGDAKRWRATITKNGGTPWTTLTAVTLLLVDPDGNTTSYTATLESANIWAYNGTGAELDQAGDWTRMWRVTDGQYPNTFGKYVFTVQPVTGG